MLMKLTNLFHCSRFAKIRALITAVYWDLLTKAIDNFYNLNRPTTPPKEAFTNSPQQQLFKTNPYSGVRFIVPFNHFFIYKSDNYVSTNHA
jgi:hypothetical protein